MRFWLLLTYVDRTESSVTDLDVLKTICSYELFLLISRMLCVGLFVKG